MFIELMNVRTRFFFLYNKKMDPKFHKLMYLIAFLALLVALLTIYLVLNEINLFFTERIKI